MRWNVQLRMTGDSFSLFFFFAFSLNVPRLSIHDGQTKDSFRFVSIVFYRIQMFAIFLLFSKKR